jgi:hypothetical protein
MAYGLLPVGSLVGAPQDVDLVTLRSHGIVRIQIAILDTLVRLDVRAEFLARPELFATRPELSSAREEGRPSRAHFSGPSRAFGSPGSARAGPKARCYFFSLN